MMRPLRMRSEGRSEGREKQDHKDKRSYTMKILHRIFLIRKRELSSRNSLDNQAEEGDKQYST
jgi:hypothetical protein